MLDVSDKPIAPRAQDTFTIRPQITDPFFGENEVDIDEKLDDNDRTEKTANKANFIKRMKFSSFENPDLMNMLPHRRERSDGIKLDLEDTYDSELLNNHYLCCRVELELPDNMDLKEAENRLSCFIRQSKIKIESPTQFPIVDMGWFARISTHFSTNDGSFVSLSINKRETRRLRNSSWTLDLDLTRIESYHDIFPVNIEQSIETLCDLSKESCDILKALLENLNVREGYKTVENRIKNELSIFPRSIMLSLDRPIDLNSTLRRTVKTMQGWRVTRYKCSHLRPILYPYNLKGFVTDSCYLCGRTAIVKRKNERVKFSIDACGTIEGAHLVNNSDGNLIPIAIGRHSSDISVNIQKQRDTYKFPTKFNNFLKEFISNCEHRLNLQGAIEVALSELKEYLSGRGEYIFAVKDINPTEYFTEALEVRTLDPRRGTIRFYRILGMLRNMIRDLGNGRNEWRLLPYKELGVNEYLNAVLRKDSLIRAGAMISAFRSEGWSLETTDDLCRFRRQRQQRKTTKDFCIKRQ